MGKQKLLNLLVDNNKQAENFPQGCEGILLGQGLVSKKTRHHEPGLPLLNHAGSEFGIPPYLNQGGVAGRKTEIPPWLQSGLPFKNKTTMIYKGKLYLALGHKNHVEYISPERYFDVMTERFLERIDKCGHLAKVTRSCTDCNHVTHENLISLHCLARFKSCCATLRYRKAYSRLRDYKIRSRKLIHAVIGFPKSLDFTRADKHIQEYAISEFMRDLKKQNIKLKGLKVFDLQDKHHKYSHYHFALIPRSLDFRKIQRIAKATQERIGLPFVFHVIGYRSTTRLLHYFAKRMAGLYGDRGKFISYKDDAGKYQKLCYNFTLDEKITPREYVENYHNSTVLAKVSRDIACNVVPDSERPDLICPECGCDTFKISIEIDYDTRIIDTPRKMAAIT